MIIPDGMLDPEVMDPPDQPFSYYAHPTDLLGTMGARAGLEVTPEGYLFTGFTELVFLVGNPPAPVACRIRTLHDGYLPVVEYRFEQGGIRYSYQLLAADLGGPLAGLPIGLARVTVANLTAEPRAVFAGAACRRRGPSNTAYAGAGDFRFGQRTDHWPPEVLQALRDPEGPAHYRFAAGEVVRNDKLVYAFPAAPAPHWRSVALFDSGLRMRRYFSGEIEGEPDPAHYLDPDEPGGVVLHCLHLGPGEQQHLDYKLPLFPVPTAGAEAALVRGADHDELLAATICYWESTVAVPSPLRLPEPKVQEYLLANTVNNLLGFDRVGGELIPSVNKFHYHHFYGGGNVNDIMAALEFMGHTAVCREGVLHGARSQFPDGSFRLEFYPEGMWWEMWGYNMWGFARHYLLTRDEGFLRAVYPAVVRAMAWQEQVTSQDPLGLWPPATIADDAYLKDCRQTGQHLWAFVAMLGAIRLARAAGETADAARFEQQYRVFRERFDGRLERQTSQTGGYICPALERTTAGNDWDNLLLLYPEQLFAPTDPRVARTLEVVRGKYQEGVLAYTWPCAVEREGEGFVFNEQPGLHYWQTPNNTQTSLVRGTPEDQRWALRELYAMLLHTSSTHLTGEFGTIPWRTRDCSHVHNLIPQGTSAAKTIQALRNMLLREQSEDLYLLSALSPQWLQPGAVIEVRQAPSRFGPLSFTLTAEADRLVLVLPRDYREAPARLLVRLPWCWDSGAALLDGQPLEPEGNHLLIPPGGREVVLHGGLDPQAEPLSYERTVQWYREEYRRRYEQFLRTGRGE